MSIEAINSIMKFTVTAKSKDDNEYKKSNIGKYAGTVLGAAYAGKSAVDIIKTVKTTSFKRFYVSYFKGFADALSDTFANNKLQLQNKSLKSIRSKSLKYGIGVVLPLIAVVDTAIGTGIGAVGDFVTNKVLMNKANKTKNVKES